jgi:hypothetical protein
VPRVEVANRRSGTFQPAAVGPARDVGIERRIVAYDDHAVPRDAGIELERGDAERERVRESGQGVLGPQPARAAVALDVERRWPSRNHRGRKRRAASATAPGRPAGKGITRR